jgi:uncharacterized protein YndB with AHSA1/START domain
MARPTRRKVTVLGLVAAVLGAIVGELAARRLRGGRPPEPMRMLVVVDAPIDAVWAAVADVPFQVEWMSEMRELVLDPPGRAHVGQRGRATVSVMGISVIDPVEVVEVSPPSRYAIRHLGLFKGGGVITLEAGADGTTTIVRWEETLAPPILPHLGALLQAPILRNVFQKDLERLKELVETGAVD